jgi:hypothetical protein
MVIDILLVIPARLAKASASRNPGGGGSLGSRFRGNDDEESEILTNFVTDE